MDELDNFFLHQEDPVKSCLLSLRDIILSHDADITGTWKYGMPFFCYKGKMFCYLWIHKKYKAPYIGFVEGKRLDHAALLIEKRARMKIMLFDPSKDLPVRTVKRILREAVNLYKTGTVKIPVKR